VSIAFSSFSSDSGEVSLWSNSKILSVAFFSFIPARHMAELILTSESLSERAFKRASVEEGSFIFFITSIAFSFISLSWSERALLKISGITMLFISERIFTASLLTIRSGSLSIISIKGLIVFVLSSRLSIALKTM